MSKEQKNKIAPRLRFPEFMGEDEWTIASLGNIYSFKTTNSFSRDDLNYENGEVKNVHYGDIHTKFSILFDITKEKVPFINPSISIEKISAENFCVVGDMIFADASEDLKDVGKSIEVINLNNEKLLSGLHTLLARQKEIKLAVGFGGHLFMSDSIRKQIQREAQGAKVLGISATRLSNISIFFPLNKTEQQKIVDCLSSLDDLITAHIQKLEALKAHKKGLMQQLFPAGEETVPKLRFAEFMDRDEWIDKRLDEVAEIITGTTPSTKESDNYGGSYLFASPVDISDERYLLNTKTKLTEKGYSQTRHIKENSVLFVCIGSTIGKIAQNKYECATNQQINSLVAYNSYSSEFIYSALEFNASKIAILAGNQAVPIINKSLFSSITIKFPLKDEQAKIAGCLSSLDDLIATQAEKINQLNNHKQGLVQSLFPKISDDNL